MLGNNWENPATVFRICNPLISHSFLPLYFRFQSVIMHFILIVGTSVESWLGVGVLTLVENMHNVLSMDNCDRSLTMTGMHSSPNQEQAHLLFCQVAIINKGDTWENVELLHGSGDIWSLKVQCSLFCLSLALFRRSLARDLSGITEPGNLLPRCPSPALPRPQSLQRIGTEVRRHHKTYNVQCHHVPDGQGCLKLLPGGRFPNVRFSDDGFICSTLSHHCPQSATDWIMT